MKYCTAVLLVFFTTMQGCSIYKAATAPLPLPMEDIKVGQNRNLIISILGTPQSTEKLDDQITDVHEFVDGYRAETKARFLLYIAGDVFTLGLAELLFWPMELAFLQGDEGRAVLTYGPDNIAKTVVLTKKRGVPLESDKSRQQQHSAKQAPLNSEKEIMALDNSIAVER